LYVSYANSQALTQSSGPAVNQVVVASALVPVASSYTMASANTSSHGPVATNAEDLDAPMEALLSNLNQSLGSALLNELGSLLRG